MLKSVVLFCIFPLICFSQVNELAPPNYIKTIQFKGNTPETQLPIIRLGEQLVLEFDVLNGNEADYYYKIDHFNFDWTPSVLAKSEFMDGFDNQRIRDYENSFNTYQIYSHYQLTIPNDQTRRLKVSGNYLLSIFNSDDELVFSRKFMVYEAIAAVGLAVKRSRDIKYIEEKQNIELIVTSNNLQINNPTNTVRAVIVQNNNLYTAISNLKPQYTIGNQLIYKYNAESSFWGGNEYLFFENKDVRAANTGIRSIDLQELYHNYLFTNVERASKPYTYNPDINGNYVTTLVDAKNPDIEADYVWIHFSLLPIEALSTKNIHVYGNFNNYVIDESTKLTYNEQYRVLTCSMLLKQGFYNYKYVVVNADGSLDEGAVSGNFYQTENNYKAIIYYRDLGARYDRIIGVGEGSSINISN
ncbi:MAG TPA: DUF5103 domain-containing protein [Mariniflexile sp.]|nr:DUF5103 domain-containing protein [Mariniflexile sp.]